MPVLQNSLCMEELCLLCSGCQVVMLAILTTENSLCLVSETRECFTTGVCCVLMITVVL